MICLAPASLYAVTLAWDPSPDTNVVGYAIYYGTNTGNYPSRIEVGNTTNAVVNVPTNGFTYFFVATAYTAEGIESLPSNEVAFNPQPGPQFTPPVVVITSHPTNTFTSTTNTTVAIAGTALAEAGIAQITWSNACTSATGLATGTTNWSTGNIPLCLGTNVITIQVTDTFENEATATTRIVRVAPPVCNPTINLTSWTAPINGGLTSVLVTAGTGCAWTASSPCNWITVSPASGSGNGTVTLTAAANTSTNARTCTLVIAGRSFSITQAGEPPPQPVFVVSPESLSAPTAEGRYCVEVSGPENQVWIALSETDWLTITSASVQSGNGTVCIAAAENTNCSPRTGNVKVAGKSVAITQGPRAGKPPLPTVFNGLFTNAAGQTQSGWLTLKTTSTLQFSGKIQLAGASHSFKGQFNESLQASVLVTRQGSLPLLLELQIESCNAEVLTGVVSDGNWSSSLRAGAAPAKLSVSPQAGAYTLVLPGVDDGLVPAGFGYCSVKIAANGRLRLAGALADGTKVKAAGYVTRHGEFPAYLPLYRRTGSLMGWLDFRPNSTNNLPCGELNWTRVDSLLSNLTPLPGFTNMVTVIGSPYQPPVLSTQPVLNLTLASLVFSGGNLGGNLERTVSLVPGNKVILVNATNAQPDKLTFRINSKTGLFRGTLSSLISPVAINFQGTLLQNANGGFGFFPGGTQGGSILLRDAEDLATP